MPYTPSAASGTFQTTLIGYLADLGIIAATAGIQRAIYDALIAVPPALPTNSLGPAVVLAANPFAVTDEAFIAATSNGLIQLPACVDANNGRIVIVAVGNNGASVEPQGANVLRDHSGVALATPYTLPANSLCVFEFIEANVWQSAITPIGAGGADFLDGGTKSADFNATPGTAYRIDLAAAAGDVTATLPTSGAGNAWQCCRFVVVSTQVGVSLVNDDTILGPGQSVSALGTVWDIVSTGAEWVAS